MERTVKLIKCDCWSEGISLEFDDIDHGLDGIKSDGIQIAFWQQGFNNTKPMNFNEKFRWCKHILHKGTPWSDMVVLDKTQVDVLIAELTEMRSVLH